MEKVFTDANFKTETTSGVVMIDFWAPWCAPCRMQGPVVERLAGKYAGKAAVGKMNVDENPVVSQQFGISGIPTLIIFKDGKEAKRFVGVQTEGVLASELDAFISSSA